jgi:excisionase family DNA binding protein
MPNDAGSLMTVHEVAVRLRVSDDSVRRMISTGELSAIRLGGGSHRRPLRVDAAMLAEQMRGWSDRTAR